MRKDYRPYVAKRGWLKFQQFYTRHFIAPQLRSLGKGFEFMRPWYVELFGWPIDIGNYATFIATPDNRISLTIWPESREKEGHIRIGDYTLVCPGVRISAAREIVVEDNCMLAYRAYITDSDWHGLYDRVAMGSPRPVRLCNNVWVGDSAIICKGVTVGENSIIGAGSVVVSSIPPNCVAAGNPAQVVKQLDPGERFRTRAHWFKNPDRLSDEFLKWDQITLKGNTFLGWLRHTIFPTKEE